MPISARLMSIPLRIGELAFAATVAGLIGSYLHSVRAATNSWPQARFFYTEIVAAISIFMALFWLIPTASSFFHYIADFILFVLWMVAFGLLVNFIGPLHCGSVFAWGDITERGTCQRWKAAVAFSFLSSIFWLASCLLGLWFVRRARRNVVATDGATDGTTPTNRRKWYSTSRV